MSKIHIAKRGEKRNSQREILAFEASDAALEIAAGITKEKANFTLGACTGLSECPG